MKIWLSKNSEIAVRDQLVTQVIFGIAGGDLLVGEKLPSTAEIARRFQIHSNTVSNAYQKLCDDGWIEFRKGSGFYVSENGNRGAENTLDRLIANFLQTARNQGFSISQIKERFGAFLDIPQSERFLIIEPDAELRAILVEEIRDATGCDVSGIGFDEFSNDIAGAGAVLTAMFDEKAKLEAILPAEMPCIFLTTNSVAGSMAGATRPGVDSILALVSGWQRFLHLAKTMLIAARISPESLIVRHTSEEQWKRGLESAAIIICDTVTAASLPDNDKVRSFRLISDASIEELKRAVA